jgi:TetR/AcrR family transcriptional regulator
MGIIERKEREKERRRDEIIEAARTVFFEKGPIAATMDEIAEVAELSKATLYLHFPSKEDLFLAVAMEGIRTLHGSFLAIITHEPSVVRTLHRMKDAYMDFFRSHRQYVQMFSFLQMSQFHKQVSEQMRTSCDIENDKHWEAIINLLRRGVEQKVIRDDIDPTEMAIVLWTNASSLMLRADNEDDMWKRRRNIDLHKTMDTSFRMTIDAILTPAARLEYQAMLRDERALVHQS